jgi:hypothetical protein
MRPERPGPGLPTRTGYRPVPLYSGSMPTGQLHNLVALISSPAHVAHVARVAHVRGSRGAHVAHVGLARRTTCG